MGQHKFFSELLFFYIGYLCQFDVLFFMPAWNKINENITLKQESPDSNVSNLMHIYVHI